MDELSLTAETGRATGTRAVRRLRATGKVPGVVYGLGADPQPLAVDWPDLRRVLSTEAGLNALIDLQVDGDTQLSIVKELQRDPVRHSVTHVDFIRIDRDTAIEVEVPIVLEGDTEQLEREEGQIDHLLFSLVIMAKPDSIPPQITVDISGLSIGESIRVGELQLPSGVTTEVDPDEAVAGASIMKEIVEPEPEEEEEELLEGEELEEGEEGEEAAGADEAGESSGGGDDAGDS